MTHPTLYHSVASRGLRALWAIEELGIDCNLVMLPYPPRFAAPDYLDINPVGTVPFLIDGDARMTESSAISEYLVNRYGPSDLAVRPEEADYGNYLDLLHYAEGTLTFPVAIFIRFVLAEPNLGLQAAGQSYLDWFSARLPKIEERLTNRDYLCASRFTAADIAVSYALFLAQMVGSGDRMGPRTAAYLKRQMLRPAFIRARDRETRASAEQGVPLPGA